MAQILPFPSKTILTLPCEMDRIYEITSISNEFLNVNFTTKFTQVSHLKNLCRIMGVLSTSHFRVVKTNANLKGENRQALNST